MHFFDNVASSHKDALDVQLRDCGPVGVLLDPLTHGLVSEDVHILVFLDAVELEDLHDVVAEATPRHLSRTFHEKHGVVSRDPLGELLVQLVFIQRGFLGLGLEVTVTLFAVVMVMVVIVTGMESSLGLNHS